MDQRPTAPGAAGRLALLLASTAVFAATGYGWSRFVVPVYRAESLVAVVSTEGEGAEGLAWDLRSEETLAAAAASLPPDTLPPGPGTPADRLRRDLAIEAAPAEPFVSVAFRDSEPETAKTVADAVVAAYVDRAAPDPTPAAAPTPAPAPAASPETEERRRLEEAIVERRAALARAEAALAAFDSAPVPVSAEAPRRVEAARRELEAMQGRLAAAETALTEAEARKGAMDRLASGAEPARQAAAAAGSPALATAVRRRDARRADAEALSETYLDNHPRMRRARDDLAASEADLRAAIERESAALDAALEVQRRGLADLRAEVSEAAATAAGPQPDPAEGRAAERTALLRSVEDERRALDAALVAWEPLRADAEPDRPAEPASALPTAEPVAVAPRFVVTPAALPTSPETRPIVLATLGFGLAGLLGGMLPFLLGRRRPRRARWPEGAETDLPAPEGRSSPAEPPDAIDDGAPPEDEPGAGTPPPPAASAASAVPLHADSPRIDELAEAVVVSRMTRLLVFGANAAEGDGTDGAVGLARRIADRTGSAVLIDLAGSGLVEPATGIMAGAPGLADYVAGRREVAEVIHADASSRVHVVPAGEGFDARLLASGAERVAMLVQAMEASYGCVVIHLDAPDPRGLKALMHEDAALIVAARLDDAVLVADLSDRLTDAGFADAIVLWLDAPSGA